MLIAPGMGFPPSIQKFHAERYLDVDRAGSNGIDAKSPPNARFPLLNQRAVITIETPRRRIVSVSRECEEIPSFRDLMGATQNRLAQILIKLHMSRHVQLLIVQIEACPDPTKLN